MHTIDKQFSFCYGHRVWSQQLDKDFCEKGDANCKCRHIHGHEATVHVFLESDSLERGMVTDFKHLGWLNTFFNDHLDHKFIVDLSDPWLNNITGLEPIWHKSETSTRVRCFKPRRPLNTTEETEIQAQPIAIPGLRDYYITGYKADAFELQGPEREFVESFFFVNFLPTSENFARWIFEIAEKKMEPLNVRVSRVDWWETPKSRSSYSK